MMGQCDICGDKTKLSIVSSGIAPVSYGMCSECHKRGAENIGVVSFWIASFGSPDQAPKYGEGVISFVAGSYIGWDLIRDYYLDNEQEIHRVFEAEFELSRDKLD